MEDRQIDIAAVKRRLNRYREKERDIDNQIERLERIESKLIGVGSPAISDLPKSHGAADDRVVHLISEKEELQEKIKSDIMNQNRIWHEIEQVLEKLPKSDERAVIRVRYHDRESWPAVAEVIFGNRKDFSSKEGSYLRRVHKLHGAALVNMARLTEYSN